MPSWIGPNTMERAGIVELRQYTLHPGARDVLVDVFGRHFVAGQEAVDIAVGGVFLDEDDPDRFVWFRGFGSMAARRTALERFYYGPVWRAHREVANATMIDSDDVLLLRPSEPAHPPSPTSAPAASSERVQVGVYVIEPDRALESWLVTEVHGVLERQLRTRVAMWRTEPAANTFPALPVRRDHAVVWSATFEDADDRAESVARLESSDEWTSQVQPRLATSVAVQRLRLEPAPFSRHPASRRSLLPESAPS